MVSWVNELRKMVFFAVTLWELKLLQGALQKCLASCKRDQVRLCGLGVDLVYTLMLDLPAPTLQYLYPPLLFSFRSLLLRVGAGLMCPKFNLFESFFHWCM